MRRVGIYLLLINLAFIISCEINETTQHDHLNIADHVTYAEDDYQDIIDSHNILGFKLLSEIKHDDQQNILISPTSLFIALSILYNGADGETKKEIATTLQKENIRVSDLNRANASLISAFHQTTDDITLRIAHSMWLNDQFHFQSHFTQHIEDYFNGSTEEIDVFNQQSPQRINNWVRDATNGKINQMIDSLNENTVALLLNAIYFQADWTIPFDKKHTKEKQFYLENDSTITVPFMKLEDEILYAANEYFQAVQLTYGNDGDMNMTIFLPHKNYSLEEFEQMMTFDHWQTWQTKFSKREGTLWLPRFQTEYDIILNESLQALGMSSAFNERANFTNMVEEDVSLMIDEIKQKTFLEVNEKGTEGAASTSIAIEKTSAPVDKKPFDMKVNRPFAIAITDQRTGAILFLGFIQRPLEDNDH